MSKPLISVIVPIYNVEQYIEKCVTSILEQTYVKLEIILVNDGSKDRSLDVCERIATTDKRIVVLNKKNGGLSDARNAGICCASGDYLAFVDGDDFWNEKDFLSKMMSALVEKKDIIMFQYKRCNADGSKTWENSRYINEEKLNNISYEKTIARMLHTATLEISACTKLVRRDLVLEHNIFFQKGLLSEDIDWSLNLFLNAKSIYVYNNPGYIYRIRENSISRTVNKKHCEALLFIIDKWSKILLKMPDENILKRGFLGYLSYQYYILIGYMFINKLEKEINLESIQWIVRYSINNKTRICQVIHILCGRKFTSKLCARYILRR